MDREELSRYQVAAKNDGRYYLMNHAAPQNRSPAAMQFYGMTNSGAANVRRGSPYTNMQEQFGRLPTDPMMARLHSAHQFSVDMRRMSNTLLDDAPLDLSSGKPRVTDQPIDLTVKKPKVEDDDVIVVGEITRPSPHRFHQQRTGLTAQRHAPREPPSMASSWYNTSHSNSLKNALLSQAYPRLDYGTRMPSQTQKPSDSNSRNICAVRPQLHVLKQSTQRSVMYPGHRLPGPRMEHAPHHMSPAAASHSHAAAAAHSIQRLPSGHTFAQNMNRKSPFMNMSHTGLARSPSSSSSGLLSGRGSSSSSPMMTSNSFRQGSSNAPPSNREHMRMDERILAERRIVNRYAGYHHNSPTQLSQSCSTSKPQTTTRASPPAKVASDARMLSARSCEIFKKEMALAKQLSNTPRPPAPVINNASIGMKPRQDIAQTSPASATAIAAPIRQNPVGQVPVTRSVPVANVNPIIQNSSLLPDSITKTNSPSASRGTDNSKWWSEHVSAQSAHKEESQRGVKSPQLNGSHVVRSRGTFDVPVTPQSFPSAKDVPVPSPSVSTNTYELKPSCQNDISGVPLNHPVFRNATAMRDSNPTFDRQNISDLTRDFSIQFLKTYGNKDSELVRKLEAEAQISQAHIKSEPVENGACMVSEISIKEESKANVITDNDVKPLCHIKQELKSEPVSEEKPEIGRRPTAMPLKLARKRHCMDTCNDIPRHQVSSTHLEGFKDVLTQPFVAKRFKFELDETCAIIKHEIQEPEQVFKEIRRLPAKLQRKSERLPRALPKSPTSCDSVMNAFDEPNSEKDSKQPETLLPDVENVDSEPAVKQESPVTECHDRHSEKDESSEASDAESEQDDVNSFVDFHPEILPARTRMQTASRKSSRPLQHYNKYAAYEVELEKEEARKQLRKQLKKRERRHERLSKTQVVNETRHHEILEKIKEKQRLKTARESFMPHSVQYKKKMKRLRKQKLYAMHNFSTKSDSLWTSRKRKEVPLYKSCGETILHRAARQGYVDVARESLESGQEDVNVRDNAGFSPLHECSVRGFVDIATLLLDHGADVNCSSMEGIRPIHDAVESNHLEMTRLLIRYGADPSIATYSGVTLLRMSITDDMRRLITGYLADVNGTDGDASDLCWTLPAPFEEDPCDILNDIPQDDELTTQDVEFEMKRKQDCQQSTKRLVPYFGGYDVDAV